MVWDPEPWGGREGDTDTHTPKYSQEHAEHTSDGDGSPNRNLDSTKWFCICTRPSVEEQVELTTNMFRVVDLESGLNQISAPTWRIPVEVQ